MQKVFEARNVTEAHLVLGLLGAEGIEGIIKSEALFSTIAGATAIPSMLPSVWIDAPQDLPRARNIIEHYLGEHSKDIEEEGRWICPSCGEEVESEFLECWMCGTARPQTGSEKNTDRSDSMIE